MKLTTFETEERPTNISTFQLALFNLGQFHLRDDFKTKKNGGWGYEN